MTLAGCRHCGLRIAACSDYILAHSPEDVSEIGNNGGIIGTARLRAMPTAAGLMPAPDAPTERRDGRLHDHDVEEEHMSIEHMRGQSRSARTGDLAAWLQVMRGQRLTRRQVLRTGTMLGLSIPLLSGLLAACGGDDDDDDEPTATAATGGQDASPTTADVAATASGGSTPQAEGGTPVNGGTLTIIQRGSIPDMDPHSSYDSDAAALYYGTYEMLLILDGSDTFEYKPMLADSWESNEDQTEWTFTIAEGITFHDGTPCDAEAVVTSFQRFHQLGLGPVSVITRFVASPEDITAPDATTITFKLSYGTDIFLAAMASQYGPLVVSPAAVEANKTDADEFAHEWLRENMVGTGPYKLKESVLGDHVTLERFEEYHRGWDGPHFDQILFRNVEESQTQRQLVESGDADALTYSLTPADVTAMQEEGKTQVQVYDIDQRRLGRVQPGQAPRSEGAPGVRLGVPVRGCPHRRLRAVDRGIQRTLHADDAGLPDRREDLHDRPRHGATVAGRGRLSTRARHSNTGSPQATRLNRRPLNCSRQTCRSLGSPSRSPSVKREP